MRIQSICLFLLLPTMLTAQEGRTVKCRLAVLNANVLPPAMLAASGEGAEISVNVPNGSISEESVLFSKTNTFSFLSATDRTPAANATIPVGVSAAILLFVAAPQTPGALPWRVFVIEDSARNFPDGGAFVANFHNQEIRFVIGENKLVLRPGGSHGISRPKERDDFNMAAVVFQFQLSDIWRNASESMLRFLPGSRYLMFAFVDSASGRPRVVTFQDFKKSAAPIAAQP